MVHELMGRPPVSHELLGGAAYTLSASGTEFALHLGARVVGDAGETLAPVHVVLESDSRKPEQKHRILELYTEYGVKLPDTAPMAVHRGRIDLLEAHLARDPAVLGRRYAYSELFPPEMGCDPRHPAAIGSPLDGVTLLHLAIEYDEVEIVRWLLDHGADVNARATDGHTPLFGTVVSYPNFWMNYQQHPQIAPIAQMLVKRGADPSIRATLRHEVGWGGKGVQEYREVTAAEYGLRFVEPLFVSQAAVSILANL